MTQVENKPQIIETGWFKKGYRDTWQAGAAQVFCLTDDIEGLTTEGISQIDNLMGLLAERRPIVLRYNPESGFSFALESMRKLANDLLGPKPKPKAGSLSVAPATGGDEDDWFTRPKDMLTGLRLVERLLTKIDDERPLDRRPENTKTAYRRVAVVIDEIELFCPNSSDKAILSDDARFILALLFRWGNDPRIGRNQNPIFFCTAELEELHANIRSENSGIKIIRVPLPSAEERRTYIERYLGNTPIPLIDVTIEELVNLGSGLNIRHYEDIFLLAARSGGVSRALVTERKRDIINNKYPGAAELLIPLPGGFSAIGGMENVKAFLNERVIGRIRNGSKRAPKGILLSGPPGNGKTLLVEALAWELGFSVINLKPSSFLNKYVGESEQRLRNIFRLAESMAPTCIFIDEVEQVFRRGNESNSVDGSVFSEVLTFMGKPSLKGRVLVVGATNLPDQIDPAMVRPGRFEAQVPILPPTADERRSIIAAQAVMQEVGIAADAIEIGVKGSEKYSGADLSALVAKALEIADRDGREEISADDMAAAVRKYKSNTIKTSQYYIDLAVKYCTDEEYLPESYRTLLNDPDALDGRILEAKPAEPYQRQGRE